mgnify:CR=1 FL=1
MKKTSFIMGAAICAALLFVSCASAKKDSTATETNVDSENADSLSANLENSGISPYTEATGEHWTGSVGYASQAEKEAVLEELEKFSTDWESPSLKDIEDCGYFYTSPEYGQFSMIEGEFKKSSGYAKSAYGFVFGYGKPASNGLLSNYIRFEINTDGEYALYKWENRVYTDLLSDDNAGTAYFSKSSAINAGYNSTNKLKVGMKNGKWNVYINGTLIKEGIEPIANGTHGVMGFFSVGKANQEDLPNTPVVVSYRITDANLYSVSKERESALAANTRIAEK